MLAEGKDPIVARTAARLASVVNAGC
jgi:hypothetical protein